VFLTRPDYDDAERADLMGLFALSEALQIEAIFDLDRVGVTVSTLGGFVRSKQITDRADRLSRKLSGGFD
jgi:hypothetical protein